MTSVGQISRAWRPERRLGTAAPSPPAGVHPEALWATFLLTGARLLLLVDRTETVRTHPRPAGCVRRRRIKKLLQRRDDDGRSGELAAVALVVIFRAPVEGLGVLVFARAADPAAAPRRPEAAARLEAEGSPCWCSPATTPTPSPLAARAGLGSLAAFHALMGYGLPRLRRLCRLAQKREPMLRSAQP